MWRWLNARAMPLFVCSLTLVVLSGGALVGLLAFQHGGRAAADTPADCLVGEWMMREDNRQTNEGEFSLASGEPLTVFDASGTGSTDYGDRTRMRGTVLMLPVTIEISGTVTFRYAVGDDDILTIDIRSNNTQTRLDAAILGDLDPPSFDPGGAFSVRCDDDQLTLHAADEQRDMTVEYARVR